MAPNVQASLERILPPAAYEFLRPCYWWLKVHFPAPVRSWAFKLRPEAFAFGGARAEQLAEQCRAVNVSVPTRMCRVMTKHGSDKGRGHHNYTTLYAVLFRGWEDRPLKIFELGLGTNNPAIPSNMGLGGRPGASLRGWRELFPRSLVYGADIDRGILFREERIETFYCDQLNDDAIRDLWSHDALRDGMDIIVEDGFHSFDANIFFLARSLAHLRAGGLYIIEDIHGALLEKWKAELAATWSPRYPNYDFVLVSLPNPAERYGNNLLIIRKPA